MKKKILIVDDDTTFSGVLSDALSADKYTVFTAKNGKEGLEKFDLEKPDLVLLDILMPEVSGVGFLKTIKERDGEVKTPVLISSNIDSMEEISGALALGAKGYIVKSEQDVNSIIATIERTLNNL